MDWNYVAQDRDQWQGLASLLKDLEVFSKSVTTSVVARLLAQRCNKNCAVWSQLAISALKTHRLFLYYVRIRHKAQWFLCAVALYTASVYRIV